MFPKTLVLKYLLALCVNMGGIFPTIVFSQVMEPMHFSDLYPKQYVDKKPIPYTDLREANVMWLQRVWRVVDMREKVNLGFYFPIVPAQGRISFMSVVLNALRMQQIHAYSAFDSSSNGSGQWDDSFTLLLTPKEVNFALSNTQFVETENEFGETVITEVTTGIGLEEIFRFKIKEEVFFDNERGVMETRILGIAPLIPDLNSGNEGGYKEAFWIYFPEARKVFAKMLSYNLHNDVMALTYDELFTKRKFHSYIVKVSNVYERSLDRYNSPMDALLKAEDIENYILNQELDLWHY